MKQLCSVFWLRLPPCHILDVQLVLCVRVSHLQRTTWQPAPPCLRWWHDPGQTGCPMMRHPPGDQGPTPTPIVSTMSSSPSQPIDGLPSRCTYACTLSPSRSMNTAHAMGKFGTQCFDTIESLASTRSVSKIEKQHMRRRNDRSRATVI